ncbi:hypothetical protein DPMN_092622 [Dreissena polymorpha]|uniref:Uncharacterized protein n=1 Tax=Dreissena polymorpha TaxID=45954 RepID=A0A9D4R1W2_DREPO|nr:hypothetical protein DPMN_092622 [Dreissena polymorpha]
MNNGDLKGVAKQHGHFYVLAQVSPACSPVAIPSNLVCESWHISSDIELRRPVWNGVANDSHILKGIDDNGIEIPTNEYMSVLLPNECKIYMQ